MLSPKRGRELNQHGNWFSRSEAFSSKYIPLLRPPEGILGSERVFFLRAGVSFLGLKVGSGVN